MIWRSPAAARRVWPPPCRRGKRAWRGSFSSSGTPVWEGFFLSVFTTDSVWRNSAVRVTGPEYALEWIKRVEEAGIEYHTDTAVFDAAAVSRRETPQERSSETAPAGYRLKISSPSCGVESVFCRALVLASGCRERTRGQLRIPGGRPAGVYTAGAVQYMMNVQNYLPGRSAVVLGSGDIGLIMARRMKWEGIDVKMVLGERASGLLRNYIQCIKDWDIPIRFSHTVVQIHGRKRITGVTIAPVAKDGSPDLEGSQYIRCDLLVVAAGLIPETELWKKIYFSEGKVPCEIKSEDEISTQRSGVFVCGNVVRQYDTADEVSASGRRAGRSAARYLEKFREFISGFDSDAGRNRNLLQAEDTEVLPDLFGRQKPLCELKEEGGKTPKRVMTEKGLDYLSVHFWFFDRREQCKDCVLYLLSPGLPNESPGQK